MPLPNEHTAGILDPDKFQQDSFRRKNIAPGIDIIIGKLKGESKMTAQAYRFDKEKFLPGQARAWLEDHKIDYIDFEVAKSILSAKPKKKGKDLIIPFVKDGTEAFDDKGNKYIITAEALDKDFKSWEGGIVTVNHKVKEQGKIAEVWREKPFVYGRFTGLSDEALEIIFSPAYRGVSQESEPKEIDGKDVTRLQGRGCTFVIYPEIPACSLDDGCGKIDIASIIKSIEGDDMDTKGIIEVLEYIGDNPGKISDDVKSALRAAMEKLDRKQFFKDILGDIEKNPEMVDDDMWKMMERMMSSLKSLKPNFSLNTQNSNLQIKSTGGTKGNMTGEEISAEALEKIKSENEALKKQNEALTSENTGLKSQLAKMDEGTLSKIESAVKTALKDRDDQLAAAKEHGDAVKELMSVMKKENVEEFLKTNPTVPQIQSMTKALKASGGKVGAGSGTTSTDPQNYEETNKRFNKRLGRK